MALIELYLYPFKNKNGSAIAAIKMYRLANDVGLAEAKFAIDQIYIPNVSFRNRIPLEPLNASIIKPKSKELLFYSGDNVRLCLEIRDKLEKEVGATEIIYNGNMKTLELLYGR